MSDISSTISDCVIPDCKRRCTMDNVAYEFAKDDNSINKCNGCNHLTYDGEICSCDYIN